MQGMKELPKLTDEQRQALTEQPSGPVYVVDVNSQDQYVIIRADEYRHYQALFESDQFDISETYAAQEHAVKPVWDDPALDEYGTEKAD